MVKLNSDFSGWFPCVSQMFSCNQSIWSLLVVALLVAEMTICLGQAKFKGEGREERESKFNCLYFVFCK